MKKIFFITSIFFFLYTPLGWALPSCKTDKLNNCEALVTFSNGIVYFGEWKNNQKHGFGTVLTKTFLFSGEWIDNQFGNEGLMYFIDSGNTYIGEFKNNIINGKGIFTLANGQKQEGVWKNEKFVSAMKINKDYQLRYLIPLKNIIKKDYENKNQLVLNVDQISKMMLVKKIMKLKPVTEEDEDDPFSD